MTDQPAQEGQQWRWVFKDLTTNTTEVILWRGEYVELVERVSAGAAAYLRDLTSTRTAANGLREKAELFDRMAPFFDQVDLVGTRGPAGSAKERRRREEEEHEYAAVAEAVYALLEAEALTTTQSLSGGEG